MTQTRKLAAILAADVVGYSKLAGADEGRTLARLRALRSDLIDPTIALHHGRVVNRTGDGVLIEFRSVVDAVRCGIEVQTGMVERNAGLPPERRIEFRVGIHSGDVVEESDGDLMGDGVNIAARPLLIRAAFVSLRTPIAKCVTGSKKSSSISARKNSRTSFGQCGLMRLRPDRLARRPNRMLPHRKAQVHQASPSWSCPSPISAVIQNRNTSLMA
jgi:Adenylate and Guanylate cyclase catalytic domain